MFQINLDPENVVEEDPGAAGDDGISVVEVESNVEDSSQSILDYKSEMDAKLAEFQQKVENLEAEKSRLLGLLSDKAMTVSVGTGTDSDIRDQAIRHIPASIMSLSTGSDESAVEDEKFVKIKPCEMESSSSKASSQSGKENLEFEEQILHLNEQVEALKQELKVKDEECKSIKLELESTLLERNVETQSISDFTSEVKVMKQNLIAKDQELDDLVLVLEDLLDQVKPFNFLPTDETNVLNPIEAKIYLVKEIPNYFKSLSQELKEKQIALDEINAELKELQDQQSEIIGGYQLITENYEKLQSEFEDFRQTAVSSDGESKDELNQELDRFREELLSKDEDLMEIQGRYEELEQNLKSANQELEELRATPKLQDNVKCEEAKIERMDKYVEIEPETVVVNVGADVACEGNTPNFIPSSALSTRPEEDSCQIKKLKEQCLVQLRLANIDHHRLESSLRKELTELESRMLSQENEIEQKTIAVEHLLQSVQDYQESINRKTEEINDTITTKNQEIDNLMSTYSSYYESKEKMVAELSGTIEQKNHRIKSLEVQTKKDYDEIYRLREEMQSLSETLQKVRSAHQKEVSNLAMQLKRSQDIEASLRAEFQAAVDNHTIHLTQASLDLQNADELKSRCEILNLELSSLRKEHLRVTNLLEATKQRAREEYQSKLKEEEVLRESEAILLQQRIDHAEEELKKGVVEIGKNNEYTSKLKVENLNLQTVIAGIKVEKESLQVEYNFQKDELRRKDDLIVRLETELKTTKREVEILQSAVNEAEDRVCAAEARFISSQHQSREEAVSAFEIHKQKPHADSEKLQRLQEEVRLLNESIITKDRKIELLQSKIFEIETSEIKAFEESFMLKGWVRQLELDNLKYQEDLSNANNDTGENPKIKTLQDETIRLVYALDERDKRCVQLTLEITRLLEERDCLQIKLSNVLKHNIELTNVRNRDGGVPQDVPTYDKEDIKLKLAQLEDTNFRMNIDLKREREARKLVQEQLLFSQTSRVYRERETSRFALAEKGRKLTPSTEAFSPTDSGHVSPASVEHTINTVAQKDSAKQVVHI